MREEIEFLRDEAHSEDYDAGWNAAAIRGAAVIERVERERDEAREQLREAAEDLRAEIEELRERVEALEAEQRAPLMGDYDEDEDLRAYLGASAMDEYGSLQ